MLVDFDVGLRERLGLRRSTIWGTSPRCIRRASLEGARWPDTGWSRLYGRRQLYVSFGNGYSGIIPGNCLRWHFAQDPQNIGCSSWGNATWQETLNDTGSTSGPGGQRADQHAADTQRFAEFVDTLPWPTMVPDTDDKFVVAGRGSGAGSAAARLGNQVGFVYLPSARTVTIDTTLVASRVRLRWVDPTSGNVITTSGDEAADPGRVVQHPGRNSAGDNDWILLVESTA